jgi:hypothetical protein
MGTPDARQGIEHTTVDCISVRVACTELLLPPSGGTSRGRQTIKGHGAICFSPPGRQGKASPSVNRRARSRGRRPAGCALGAGLLVWRCLFLLLRRISPFLGSKWPLDAAQDGSQPSCSPSDPSPASLARTGSKRETPICWTPHSARDQPSCALGWPGCCCVEEKRAYHYIWSLSWDPGLLLNPSAPLLENLPLAAPSSLRQWLCELRPLRHPT